MATGLRAVYFINTCESSMILPVSKTISAVGLSRSSLRCSNPASVTWVPTRPTAITGLPGLFSSTVTLPPSFSISVTTFASFGFARFGVGLAGVVEIEAVFQRAEAPSAHMPLADGGGRVTGLLE